LTGANIATVVDADPVAAGNQAGWQVTATGQGTDSLNGVEKVSDGAGHNFLLVGNGGYTTLQAAIDAAPSGDTIEVAAGTYGGFTASVSGINIVAVGTVTIAGSLLTDLGVPPGTALNDFFEQNHPNYSSSSGITVSANNISISGFTITGFSV